MRWGKWVARNNRGMVREGESITMSNKRQSGTAHAKRVMATRRFNQPGEPQNQWGGGRTSTVAYVIHNPWGGVGLRTKRQCCGTGGQGGKAAQRPLEGQPTSPCHSLVQIVRVISTANAVITRVGGQNVVPTGITGNVHWNWGAAASGEATVT